MTCLMEENVISKDGSPIVISQERSPSAASNVASIEQRIRRELEDLGLIQALAEKVCALTFLHYRCKYINVYHHPHFH